MLYQGRWHEVPSIPKGVGCTKGGGGLSCAMLYQAGWHEVPCWMHVASIKCHVVPRGMA